MKRTCLCSICGGVANPAFSCKLCGAICCPKCFIVGMGICKNCAAGRT